MSWRTENRATAIRSSSERRPTRSLSARWMRVQRSTSPAEKVDAAAEPPKVASFMQGSGGTRCVFPKGGRYETARDGGGDRAARGAWGVRGQQDHDRQNQRQHVRGIS